MPLRFLFQFSFGYLFLLSVPAISLGHLLRFCRNLMPEIVVKNSRKLTQVTGAPKAKHGTRNQTSSLTCYLYNRTTPYSAREDFLTVGGELVEWKVEGKTFQLVHIKLVGNPLPGNFPARHRCLYRIDTA